MAVTVDEDAMNHITHLRKFDNAPAVAVKLPAAGDDDLAAFELFMNKTDFTQWESGRDEHLDYFCELGRQWRSAPPGAWMVHVQGEGFIHTSDELMEKHFDVFNPTEM